jgi:hypothetical protein
MMRADLAGRSKHQVLLCGPGTDRRRWGKGPVFVTLIAAALARSVTDLFQHGASTVTPMQEMVR